jgi:hypothetical protein
LAQTTAALSRSLAEHVEEHERERERMTAEHNRAIADLHASNEAAAAELRTQLSEAVAEHHRLTALLEEQDRERELMAAEHRRTIVDLQVSKQEAVAECERVLTEVQQSLLVRDASRRLEVERRLIDGIDEAPRTKVDGERLASLQRGLTLAFSRVQAVLKDAPTLREPVKAGHDADLSHQPFDDADDAFVHHLLESAGATPLPEKLAAPNTVGPAQTVSGTPAETTGDQSAHDVFDAQDATFISRLMNTPDPPQETVDQTDDEPLVELPRRQDPSAADS